MKRIGCICIVLLGALGAWAVTQEGSVRTISRKDKPGTPLDGVVIRLRGSHNAVQSHTNGEFSLLLHNMENGDPYTISSIIKSGYEPAEQELLGKRIPCSDKVPLEIVLVSIADLQREKEEIAVKAREKVEVYYQKRLAELERRLAAHQLTEKEFNQRLDSLEEQYERFEPLLQAMSDKLARIDYERLDSLTAQIQTAIENGNPEEAERLIREKGNMEEREAAIRKQEEKIAKAQQAINDAQAQLDIQRALTAQQKKELADDYFRLYSVFLSRFQNDSANYYIQKRAALDTLNVDYQLQAGQFVRNIMADNELAKRYFERAYRIAETQYGEISGQMATTCLELGITYKQMHDIDKATEWHERALPIYEKKCGKNSAPTSSVLNSMGELYRMKKDYKQALEYHTRALKIREKEFGTTSMEAAICKNNIAADYVNRKQFEKAAKIFMEVHNTYEQNPKAPLNEIAINYNNLGIVSYRLGRYKEALTYFEKALAIFVRIKGEQHPQTVAARKSLDTCKQKIETH